MGTDFITDPPLPIRLDEASPEIPEGPLDQTFLDLRPQLAVAIGGAVMDPPHQTARVAFRTWLTPPPGRFTKLQTRKHGSRYRGRPTSGSRRRPRYYSSKRVPTCSPPP